MPHRSSVARVTLPAPLRVVAGGLLLAFAAASPSAGDGSQGVSMAFVLRSAAFAPDDPIPSRHGCEGADLSPPLAWSGVPAEARSLALIVDDPDAPDPAAPQRTWVHWVLYDLPPDAVGLPEAVSLSALPPGTRAGRNDWGRTGYGGPCPPVGQHHYHFKLYALDRGLGDLREPTKSELEAAMAAHVIARTELVGTYQKVEGRDAQPPTSAHSLR